MNLNWQQKGFILFCVYGMKTDEYTTISEL